MLKKLFTSLILTSSFFCHANQFESNIFQTLQMHLDYCSKLSPTTTEKAVGFNCMRDAWTKYGSLTTFNSTKSGASNVVFVLNQLINLIEDPNTRRKMSKTEFENSWKTILDMYGSELRSMTSNLSAEINDISTAAAAQRTDQFISRLVLNLGGSIGQKSNQTSTFILNGRFINCTTVGAFTSCR